MGPAAILGELGSHAHHMGWGASGLDVETVSARMSTIAAGREVYDNVDRTLGSRAERPDEFGEALRRDRPPARPFFPDLRRGGGLIWHQEEPEVLSTSSSACRPVASTGARRAGVGAAGREPLPARPPRGLRALAFATMYRDFGPRPDRQGARRGSRAVHPCAADCHRWPGARCGSTRRPSGRTPLAESPRPSRRCVGGGKAPWSGATPGRRGGLLDAVAAGLREHLAELLSHE